VYESARFGKDGARLQLIGDIRAVDVSGFDSAGFSCLYAQIVHQVLSLGDSMFDFMDDEKVPHIRWLKGLLDYPREADYEGIEFAIAFWLFLGCVDFGHPCRVDFSVMIPEILVKHPVLQHSLLFFS
jgi:hypothetical protein